jgi:Zn-dependent M32 family carboxypeptidase
LEIIVKKYIQGSYMTERVQFKDFPRIFKDMYQQIQGLNTEEKALEISTMSP